PGLAAWPAEVRRTVACGPPRKARAALALTQGIRAGHRFLGESGSGLVPRDWRDGGSICRTRRDVKSLAAKVAKVRSDTSWAGSPDPRMPRTTTATTRGGLYCRVGGHAKGGLYEAYPGGDRIVPDGARTAPVDGGCLGPGGRGEFGREPRQPQLFGPRQAFVAEPDVAEHAGLPDAACPAALRLGRHGRHARRPARGW